MQQAMIDFTKVIESSGGFDAKETLKGEIQQGPSERSAKYGAFVDWLLVNYTQPTGKGIQFKSPFEGAKTDKEAKTQMERGTKVKMSDKLKEYIYSIRILGRHTASGERIPDGIWSEHTNNAINNTYAFAYSMVNLMKDLSLSFNKFGPNMLNAFSRLVKDHPPKENKAAIDKKAQEIAKSVEYLSDEFKHFANQVITSYGRHGEQTSQNKPFAATYGKEKTTENLSAEDYIYNVKQQKEGPELANKWMGLYSNFKNQNLPNIVVKENLSSKGTTGNYFGVQLENISNMAKFKEFLKSNNIMFNDKNASESNEGIKAALDYVYGSIIKAPSQMNTLTGTPNQDYRKPTSN